MCRFILCSLFISSFFPLFGEITPLRILMNTEFCDDRCKELLVEDMAKQWNLPQKNITFQAGYVAVIWDGRTKFSYQLARAPFQKYGVGVAYNMFGVVRGTLQENDRGLVILSSKDLTEFQLISPLPESSTKYNPLANPLLRTLDPSLKEKLLTLANGKEIEITGTIYLPSRSPPLHLTVDAYSVPKSDETPAE